MNTYKFDLQLFKHFGLSLNSNKKYFIIYEPFNWSLFGVYDNVEDAVNNSLFGSTLNEYYEKCANAGYNKDGIKYDEHYIGHNYHFQKGFFQNVNMWQLLEMLCRSIKEDRVRYGIDISTINIISIIDAKLQSTYI